MSLSTLLLVALADGALHRCQSRCGNLLADIWDKFSVVLVGVFLFFTLAAGEVLVFGFVLSGQLCLQFRDLGADFLKLSLSLVFTITASSGVISPATATTTFLVHPTKLVPLHMGKLAVLLGPEITFLNGAALKLLIRWRFATWLAAESSLIALVAFSACITIIHAYLSHLAGA